MNSSISKTNKKKRDRKPDKQCITKKINSKLQFGGGPGANGAEVQEISLSPEEPQNLKRVRHHVEKSSGGSNGDARKSISIHDELLGNAHNSNKSESRS